MQDTQIAIYAALLHREHLFCFELDTWCPRTPQVLAACRAAVGFRAGGGEKRGGGGGG